MLVDCSDLQLQLLAGAVMPVIGMTATGGPEEDATHFVFTCGALHAVRDQLLHYIIVRYS